VDAVARESITLYAGSSPGHTTERARKGRRTGANRADGFDRRVTSGCEPEPGLVGAAPSNCGVTFVAGLVLGIIITALGGLFVFQARVIEGNGRARMPDLRNLIAVAALIIAIVALARSGDHDATTTSDVTVSTLEPPTSAPSTTSSAPGSSLSSGTTSTTSSTSTTELRPVTVPNVVGLEQTAAIAALQRAGLRSHVQSLALGNVPAGFVVTQTPIAYSTTTSGSMVLLGVSAGG
jgi:hypothetical protein